MTIKEARERAGMSIRELAEATGLSSAAISRYENGKRTPNVPISKRLGEILGVPWFEIMDNKAG